MARVHCFNFFLVGSCLVVVYRLYVHSGRLSEETNNDVNQSIDIPPGGCYSLDVFVLGGVVSELPSRLQLLL